MEICFWLVSLRSFRSFYTHFRFDESRTNIMLLKCGHEVTLPPSRALLRRSSFTNLSRRYDHLVRTFFAAVGHICGAGGMESS